MKKKSSPNKAGTAGKFGKFTKKKSNAAIKEGRKKENGRKSGQIFSIRNELRQEAGVRSPEPGVSNHPSLKLRVTSQ
jgi:hypothetical protein